MNRFLIVLVLVLLGLSVYLFVDPFTDPQTGTPTGVQHTTDAKPLTSNTTGIAPMSRDLNRELSHDPVMMPLPPTTEAEADNIPPTNIEPKPYPDDDPSATTIDDSTMDSMPETVVPTQQTLVETYLNELDNGAMPDVAGDSSVYITEKVESLMDQTVINIGEFVDVNQSDGDLHPDEISPDEVMAEQGLSPEEHAYQVQRQMAESLRPKVSLPSQSEDLVPLD